MGVGFHPGFLFGPADFMANGSNEDYMATSRFFVGELTPNYMISKNVSVGTLYQYSRGFNSQLRNSNFVGVNANFSDICLGNTFFMRAQPQVYYLKNDDLDGFYASTALTFAKRNFLFKI